MGRASLGMGVVVVGGGVRALLPPPPPVSLRSDAGKEPGGTHGQHPAGRSPPPAESIAPGPALPHKLGIGAGGEELPKPRGDFGVLGRDAQPHRARVLRVPGMPSGDARRRDSALSPAAPSPKPLLGGSGVPPPCPRCFSPPAPGLCSLQDKGKREQTLLLLLDSVPSTTSAPSSKWDGVGRESFAKHLSPIPTSPPGAGGGMLHGPPGVSPSWGFRAVPHPRAEVRGTRSPASVPGVDEGPGTFG